MNDTYHEFFNIVTKVLPKDLQATAWEEMLAFVDGEFLDSIDFMEAFHEIITELDYWIYFQGSVKDAEVDEDVAMLNGLAETQGLPGDFLWSREDHPDEGCLEAIDAYSDWLKPHGFCFIHWVSGYAEYCGTIVKQSDVEDLFKLAGKAKIDIRMTLFK